MLVRVGAVAAGWAPAGTSRVRLCVVGAEVVRLAACCWASFNVWLKSFALGATADRSTRGATADWTGACGAMAGARGSGDNSGVPNSSLEEFGLFELLK